MQRASVDFPQPDSPTSPNVSPRRTSNDTPSTARSRVAPPPELPLTRKVFSTESTHSVASPGPERTPAGSCVVSFGAEAAIGSFPTQRSFAKWHSATTGASGGPTLTGGGAVVRHTSTPCPTGQRGSNGQPGPSLARLGGKPGIVGS